MHVIYGNGTDILKQWNQREADRHTSSGSSSLTGGPAATGESSSEMGWLNWLSRSNGRVDVLPDLFWISKRAKYSGISLAVQRHLKGPTPPLAVILLAQFDDCLRDLQAFADQQHFDPSMVVTLCADALNSSQFEHLMLGESSDCVEILIAERHPLRSRDERIVTFASQLKCRCRIVHHLSLEDALIRAFVGPQVVSWLRQLGMPENEAIENQAVSRSILAAQKKLEKQSVNDRPASSAAEWLELNVPENMMKRVASF